MQNYSQTYVSIIVMILASIFPKMGIEVGSEALTSTISTLLVIGAGLYGFYQRWKKGDITILGSKK